VRWRGAINAATDSTSQSVTDFPIMALVPFEKPRKTSPAQFFCFELHVEGREAGRSPAAIL
jgi:hypothetical protein